MFNLKNRVLSLISTILALLYLFSVPNLTIKLVMGAEAPERQLMCNSSLLFHGVNVYSAETPHAQTHLDSMTVKDLGLETRLLPLFAKTSTILGSARLLYLIKNSYLGPEIVIERQNVVKELLSDEHLFSQLSEAFQISKSIADQEFREHFSKLDKSKSLDYILSGINSGLMTTINTVLIYSEGWGGIPLAGMMTAMTAGHSLPFLHQERRRYFDYKRLFETAQRASAILKNSKSKILTELGSVLSNSQHYQEGNKHALSQVSETLSRLSTSKYMVFWDFLYGHSNFTLPRVRKQLQSHQKDLVQLFGALAELDVFIAIAKAAKENHYSLFPEILSQPDALVEIENGHHPFLINRNPLSSVANSTRIDKDQNFIILTGSNMGGKSTYLHMIATLVIQAQLGSPVPAESMRLTPLEVKTNIDVLDSLERSASFFDAETSRILEVIERAKSPQKLLVIMDEILLGTNPEERAAAEYAIIKYLSRTDKLFLLATHDQGVTQLENEISKVKNLHVSEIITNGKMSFSYKVEPGPATTRNGLLVLESKNFPQEILKDAWSYLQDHSKQ